jgi:hypothetical protein
LEGSSYGWSTAAQKLIEIAVSWHGVCKQYGMLKILCCSMLCFIAACQVERFLSDTQKISCKAGSCGRPEALKLGSLCIEEGTCKSGHCVDGVCCESFCDGTCQGCAAILTGGPNGACLSLRANTDRGQICTEPISKLKVTPLPDACSGQLVSGKSAHFSNEGCVGVARISQQLSVQTTNTTQGTTP